MTLYQYLAYLAGITQTATVDMVEDLDMITEVGSLYCKERKDCGTNFSRIYNRSVSMAEKVVTAAEMPRLTSSQQHRSNAEAQTPREYFQRNVTIPLLDHILMCIEKQFSPSAKVAISLIGLVHVFYVQEMSTSMRLLTRTLMISCPQLWCDDAYKKRFRISRGILPM